MNAIAPAVIHETVHKFKETTDLPARALNKSDAAQRLINDWNKRVNHFKAMTQAKYGNEWSIEEPTHHGHIPSRNSMTPFLVMPSMLHL